MKFPQYLWRVATRKGAILLRRGSTPDEALSKYPESIPSQLLPIGIADHCELSDRQRYDYDHPWDWMNS